ncbi:MAG: 2-succinyl-5-enolpyruvyl-6-hydroxy-3-cyclohexene-1-carboxylic-acid synthase [Deltaproteobacteria bacterium]|nr:2-succinyl-5-enolpyruvyl-6-hydroxy-3-cyclohexene-1-carboxylic-acid synthase [Deltaproteobacteria bacterium]
MSFPNRNALWAHVMVEELALAGVHHVCISPGSRSTPLALAVLQREGLASSVHHDERSAAFFALGLAKTSRKPVALVCTSGTAAANYLPAVVEASLSHVPLIVLTADRPPEARSWGAPQTIDQLELYGRHARWSLDLPLPEPTAPMLAYLRQAMCRAVHVATRAPAGPVHLNVPLRDPLPPIPLAGDVPDAIAQDAKRARTRPTLTINEDVIRPDDAMLRPLAERLALLPRGILAVGPTPGDARLAAALARLSEATGWPILAEATTSLRVKSLGPGAIAHGELLARNAVFAREHAPQIAVRLGQALTPRALTRYVDSSAECVVIDEPGRWVDPGHRASTLLAGDPALLVGRLAELIHEKRPSRDATWLDAFQRADAAAERALTHALESEEELGELHVARDVFDALPAGVPLFVASSMPIRDVETAAGLRAAFAPVLANRGANGIDGTIASALGAAAAHGGRGALLIGDVAFLHDVNSLLTAKLLGLSFTALVINNDGGGIFSFLEVAQNVEPATFEKLWGTPHGLDVASAARAFGATHSIASTRSALQNALAESLGSRAPGARIIEVRTDRARNVEAHRRVLVAVDAALEGQPWRSST